MADDKVALEIFIEADKANLSLGELEKGFEDMKRRVALPLESAIRLPGRCPKFDD
jgi:hypothetical protein